MKAAKTQQELNYALRRVVYDLMVGARSLLLIREIKRDYSKRESARIAALIMARNLNDFLFVKLKPSRRHPDDVWVGDFDLTWQPDSGAKLTNKDKERIHKIAGHIVTSRPDPFKSNDKFAGIVRPLIKESRAFVESCVSEGKAKYTGEAPKYVKRLNGSLKKLELPKLPD